MNNIEGRIQSAYLLYECKQSVELFLQVPGGAQDGQVGGRIEVDDAEWGHHDGHAVIAKQLLDRLVNRVRQMCVLESVQLRFTRRRLVVKHNFNAKISSFKPHFFVFKSSTQK